MLVNNQLMQFDSYNQLLTWLRAQGVDLRIWGQGQAKTAEHLWHEVKRGETKLLANPARRLVESVMVIVRHGEMILIETEQKMSDGRSRHRYWPPSEKMQTGENYLDAARRGLSEELGMLAEQITFHYDSYHVIETVRESVSYPSLLAQYQMHVIEAEIHDLPAQRFTTDESSSSQCGCKKTHYWDWLPPTADLLKFI